MAFLVFADQKERIYDHPTLEMGGASGATWVRVPEEELIPLPEGARLFTMPGAHPVGWNGSLATFEVAEAARGQQAVAAFLPPGYMRTHLPATSYPDASVAPYLPLWSYTAVGWRSGQFVAAAVRIDPMDHQAQWQYDDRTLLPLIRGRLAEQPDNRLLHHLKRCATDYHCLCAKNAFYRRWEAPLPIAFACNADCVGCISLQTEGLVPASHERIGGAPTLEELCALAHPHLTEAEEAIVSFGQGCEGEPLLHGDLIEETIRRLRSRTDRGTIHLNTNGSPCRSGLHHLKRCATDYHCLCAKNAFYRRWEAPLPIAFACNADCVGCISLQTEGLVPASHERIGGAPTLEELCALAHPHLTEAEEAIVSFGQGCEGEPLLHGDLIEETIRRLRSRTDRGTIHLNTNGSLPQVVERLCMAGLDSIRISLNATQPEAYAAYYRPKHYEYADVVESIRRAKAHGCYTSINLLVFPGVADREEEVEGLLHLIVQTGLDLIQMKNLNIDPRRYLESLPPPRGGAIGMRELVRTIRREAPQVDIGYFNRPREHFGRSLCAALTF